MKTGKGIGYIYVITIALTLFIVECFVMRFSRKKRRSTYNVR